MGVGLWVSTCPSIHPLSPVHTYHADHALPRSQVGFAGGKFADGSHRLVVIPRGAGGSGGRVCGVGPLAGHSDAARGGGEEERGPCGRWGPMGSIWTDWIRDWDWEIVPCSRSMDGWDHPCPSAATSDPMATVMLDAGFHPYPAPAGTYLASGYVQTLLSASGGARPRWASLSEE